MATIKITIITEKTALENTQKITPVAIKETKDKKVDVVDKIANLLNIERRKSGNERGSIKNC